MPWGIGWLWEAPMAPREFDTMTPAQRLRWVRSRFAGKNEPPENRRCGDLDAVDLALFFELPPTPPAEKDVWLREFRSRLLRGRTGQLAP